MAMTKVQELEQRREQRLADLAKKEDEQLAVDLEARERIEEQHGLVAAVKVARFRPGQPARAFVRTPTPAEYKRFKDQVSRAHDKKSPGGRVDAAELLARSCWVYPETPEARDAMLDVYPGLLSTIGVAAAALAEGAEEDEKKG